MSRISIDVTDAEHQRLKAMAALQGKTIKEFVLASTLGREQPGSDEANALAELEDLLEKRLANARENGFSTRTVEDIFQQARDEANSGPNV